MSKYYSFRIYVDKFPSVIDNSAVYTIAEKISELVQCDYDSIGYGLLHPDYDYYRDIGKSFSNNSSAKEKFLKLSIPIVYLGKTGNKAAPFIKFELTPRNSSALSDFSVVFYYPSLSTSPLFVEIDIKAGLLVDPISSSQYLNIMDSLGTNRYQINSALLRYYSGNTKRTLLSGGQLGFCTLNDMRLLRRASRYNGANRINKLMDIFMINSITNKAISSGAKAEICQIVGESNVSSGDTLFTFALPQTFMGSNKMKLRKLLEREGLVI